MTHRLLWSTGALATTVALLILAWRLGDGAPGDATLTTPWGDPDLQGIWTDEFRTPLQRHARYGGREFMTDAEFAELEEQRREAIGRDFRPPSGTEADVAGAYNALFDLGPKRISKRTSLIIDPPDGRIPPRTPEAQRRSALVREYTLAILAETDACRNRDALKKQFGNASCDGGTYSPNVPRRDEPIPYYNVSFLNRAHGPEDRSIAERCMGGQLPDFGGFRRVVQAPGFVAISYDVGQGQGWQRVVPANGGPHLPASIQLWFGDSRGRWEGKTLVIDVTNFSGKTDFHGAREHLHLVERWTRTAPNTLEYMVTIDDPTTWTKPWTVKQEMTRQNEQENRIYMDPRCHEGNYGLTGMLSGARAAEEAFAAGRGPDPASIDLYSTSIYFRRHDDDQFVFVE